MFQSSPNNWTPSACFRDYGTPLIFSSLSTTPAKVTPPLASKPPTLDCPVATPNQRHHHSPSPRPKRSLVRRSQATKRSRLRLALRRPGADHAVQTGASWWLHAKNQGAGTSGPHPLELQTVTTRSTASRQGYLPDRTPKPMALPGYPCI